MPRELREVIPPKKSCFLLDIVQKWPGPPPCFGHLWGNFRLSRLGKKTPQKLPQKNLKKIPKKYPKTFVMGYPTPTMQHLVDITLKKKFFFKRLFLAENCSKGRHFRG